MPGVWELTETLLQLLAHQPSAGHQSFGYWPVAPSWTGPKIPPATQSLNARTNFTVSSCVAWRAVALVLANVMEAGAPTLAWARGTGVWFACGHNEVQVRFQATPNPSLLSPCPWQCSTYLTVLPCEAVGTGTVVFSICLLACAPVTAGPRAAEPWPD